MKYPKNKRSIKKTSSASKRKIVIHHRIIRTIKNNKLASSILVLLLIAAILIGYLFVQKYIGDSAVQGVNPIIVKANSLKSQAVELLHSDPSKSKTLFLQAREKYQAVNDKNNIIDVEAQLYLIEHVYKAK